MGYETITEEFPEMMITISNATELFDPRFLARGIHRYNRRSEQGWISENNYGWITKYDERWVYGYPAVFPILETHEDKAEFIIESYSQFNGGISHPSCGILRVVPGTLGRYTGVNDKNNIPIFEGDIVKFIVPGKIATGYSTKRPAIVAYSEKYRSWYLSSTDSTRRSYPLERAIDIEIISDAYHENQKEETSNEH